MSYKEYASKTYVNKTVSEKKTDFTEITSLPDWLSPTKPIYTAEDVGADPAGSSSEAVATAKSYTDQKIADLINGAPTTLDTLSEIATAMQENEEIVSALDEAIGTKANGSDLTAHTSAKSNPHSVTADQLGLLTETWTFTLANGNTVTKSVVVK